MKKAAMFTAAALLFVFVLCGSFAGTPARALADSGTVITFNDPDFKQALIDAGVQADGNGDITIGAMAVPTSLEITGGNIDDITEIGYAVSLTTLKIKSNNITLIPSCISNLTHLTALDLSDNLLDSNGLPSSLWTMTGITTLDLMMNRIETLSSGIGSLTNLTSLNLYGNGLTSLPAAIGNLNKLTGLYLHINSLSCVPDSIGNLTNLTNLTLWGNQITSLPGSICNLAKLQEFDASVNLLPGLPSSFGSLTGLTKLVLSYNRLTALPAGVFAGMTHLGNLDVEYNYLDPQSGSPDRAEINAALAHTPNVSYARQNDYAVSLNYNGGAGATLPKTNYYYGESVTLPAATWACHVFTGWDIDGDGAPDKQAGAAAAVIPKALTDASVVFKAIYGYKVTFKTQAFGTIDGGSADVSYEVNVGEHVSRVPVVCANADYTFLGWYEGTTKLTEANILALSLSSSRTFTAKFEATGTIYFQDARFAAALTAAGVDGNHDGFITSTEMKALTSLSLPGGQFTNIAGIGEAAYLLTLRLRTGHLTMLPDEIGTLSSLKVLDIGGNAISSLPAAVSGLTSLKELDMDSCGLTSLPSGIAGLHALTTLNLNNNYFYPGGMPAGTPAFASYATQHTYAVKLDFVGGAGPALPKTAYYYGEPINLPAATKAGAEFYGWDINGDAKPDIVGAGSTRLMPNPPGSVQTWTYHAVYMSTNAHLSGIAITAGAYLSPALFSSLQPNYTVTLYDYVGNVTITPRKANAAAKMRIDGVLRSIATVSLASYANTRDVKVSLTAEDGIHTFTYTIHVIRAKPVNLGLTRLALTPGATMSPVFSSAGTSYTVLVPASMSAVTVTASRANTAASVSIEGTACPALSKAVSVGMGLSKTVQVVVSAPASTDKKMIYTLTLKRGTALSKFSAIPKVGTACTLSPGGTNRMTFSYTMGGPGSVKMEAYKSGKWVQIMSRAEASAGAKSWAWDGKVSEVYLPPGTYSVRIMPSAFGMNGASSMISVRIVNYPIVTWGTVPASFRATGVVRALCSFKVNNPTDAVVRVYNSSGKIAATVKSITNLLPSSVLTAITWNGKATAGNTAGLKAGALVPTGTYTIRITVGAKVYTKTIKITR